MRRLSPRQRVIDGLVPHLDQAVQDHYITLRQGKEPDHSHMNRLQKQIAEAHKIPQLVQCFKCEQPIDLDQHNFSRLAVLNIGHYSHETKEWEWDHYNSEPLELPLCRACHDHALSHAQEQEVV